MSEFFELFAGHKVAVFDRPIEKRLVAETLAAGMKKSSEPFMVMSLDQVVEKFRQWQREMPGIKPYFAVKCNDDPVLLKTLSSLGAGFDCASKAEIDKVIKEDIASVDEIIYANPIKTREYLEHATKVGVQRTTFDSEEELYKIKAAAPNMQTIIRISCSDMTAQRHLGNKFGCDPIKEAPKLLQKAKDLGISVIGVSVHVGSGCNNAAIFEKAITFMRSTFDAGLELGHPMNVLDIGGGFPGMDTQKISLPAIASYVNPTIEKYFPASENYEVIAEPGRYFAASPFSAVARIVSSIKVPAKRITEKEDDADNTGYMYYINDGIYTSFSCKFFDHSHPVGEPLASDDGTPQRFPACIWGPTCDGLDLVEPVVYHRRLHVGEWLYYDNMGAYTNVTSSAFNGFSRPKTYYFADENTMKTVKAGVQHIL